MEDDFLFSDWVIFRFQPLTFRGVPSLKLIASLPRENGLFLEKDEILRLGASRAYLQEQTCC